MYCNMFSGLTPTVHVIGYDDMDNPMSLFDYAIPVPFVPKGYDGCEYLEDDPASARMVDGMAY